MPICIECRNPVAQLYTTYSKADDRSLGKGVRLTQCPRCKRFADKYVEHDFVVLFIDLVLIKPQVYRHLLFNRLGRKKGDGFDPSIIRLGVLLLLFDVYLTWARIEKATQQTSLQYANAPRLSAADPASQPSALAQANSLPSGPTIQPPNLLSSQSLLTQYVFFLLLCTLETLAFHFPIRLISTIPLPSAIVRWTKAKVGTPTKDHDRPGPPTPSTTRSAHSVENQPTSTPPTQPTTLLGLPPYYHPNRISTALLVSSCTKLFPMLMVIWDYDLPSSVSAVSWAVIVNNVAALEILIECGYVRAGLLAAVGAVCRGVVGHWMLRAAGLGDAIGTWGVEWLIGREGVLGW